MYEVMIEEEFSAAHALRGYRGKCENMHGHNWKVEVEVCATGLDELGMGLDFKVIKTAAAVLTAKLDHHYLNEIEPFDRLNPTAENLAACLYKGLSEMLNDSRIRVQAVTLWETDRAGVCYREV